MAMRNLWGNALLMGCLLATAPAFADDTDELRKLRDTTINLVNALVEQGVLTRAKADALIAQAQQAAAKPTAAAVAPNAPAGAATPERTFPAEAPGAPGAVRVPYVPDRVTEEIGKEGKREVLAPA